MKRSLEQICREILSQAIADELVAKCTTLYKDPDPYVRTAGELAGLANLLQKLLRENGRE